MTDSVSFAGTEMRSSRITFVLAILYWLVIFLWLVILTVALDFGLSYARRGELLDYIKRLGCFDENCTRFYVAEVIQALEYLHSIGIIHRYCMFTFLCLLDN